MEQERKLFEKKLLRYIYSGHLQLLLEDAIKAEHFDSACKLRDEIKRRVDAGFMRFIEVGNEIVAVAVEIDMNKINNFFKDLDEGSLDTEDPEQEN